MFSRVNKTGNSKKVDSAQKIPIGPLALDNIESRQNSTELGQEKKSREIPIRTSGFFLSSKHDF